MGPASGISAPAPAGERGHRRGWGFLPSASDVHRTTKAPPALFLREPASHDNPICETHSHRARMHPKRPSRKRVLTPCEGLSGWSWFLLSGFSYPYCWTPIPTKRIRTDPSVLRAQVSRGYNPLRGRQARTS